MRILSAIIEQMKSLACPQKMLVAIVVVIVATIGPFNREILSDVSFIVFLLIVEEFYRV